MKDITVQNRVYSATHNNNYTPPFYYKEEVNEQLKNKNKIVAFMLC